MLRLLVGAAWLAGPVWAAEWATRDGDLMLGPGELEAELIGREVMFYDNGVSAFAEDGGYSYTYDQGGTAFGRYELGEDGVVCIVFANGFDRCDMYVRSGTRLVLITEKGERFPIRPRE